MTRISNAKTHGEFQVGKQLFKSYAAELGVDLSFQHFEEELENIENQYCGPSGSLLIVYNHHDHPIGCCGIRKIDPVTCELKRMYLHSQFRGQGIGQLMIKESIKTGNDLGYEIMRLDTLPSMKSAIYLYKKCGFYEITPYRYNPIKGTVYLEIKLK